MRLWCLVGVSGNRHVRYSSVREEEKKHSWDLWSPQIDSDKNATSCLLFLVIPWISREVIGPWALPSNNGCLKSYIWCLKAQEGNLLRIWVLLQVFVISVVTPKSHHFISREQAPALHLFLLFICLPKLLSCCCSYLSLVFFARKFVVLSCHFRRQKNRKQSSVASKVMLVVAFDDITSSAEHLTASGIWIILTFLLSSPTIFIFCWSIRGRWAKTISS